MKMLIIQMKTMTKMTSIMMNSMMITSMIMTSMMMKLTSMMKVTRARSRSRLVPGRVKVQARHWSNKQTFMSK